MRYRELVESADYFGGNDFAHELHTRVLSQLSEAVEYGEWKYWVDAGGAMIRVDNHDIEAEDWYQGWADEDDPDYGDWRTLAFKDGYVRLNMTQRPPTSKFASEIDVEYLPEHAGARALEEVINFLKNEPEIESYFVNNQEYHIARQAIAAMNRDRQANRRLSEATEPPSEQMIDAFYDALEQSELHGKVSVSLHPHANGTVELSLIRTDPTLRGQGLANQAMALLTEVADRFGIILTLGVANDADGRQAGLTTEQLWQWYSGWGFEGGESMKRYPEEPLTESRALPAWWRQGRVLSSADLDRLDASEFIEGDEFDYEWRLCRVPTRLFPTLTNADIAEMEQREPGQMDDVRAWLRKEGIEALRQVPLVALLTANGISLLDGYHRATAATEMGWPEVYAAVGLGERTD